MLCGVCNLKAQIATHQHEHRGRLFPSIKTSDIQIIKRAMHELGHGSATWHGFRRGRLTDLLHLGDLEGSIMIEELAASGGWHRGSRAIFRYAESGIVNMERMINEIAAGSDSD